MWDLLFAILDLFTATPPWRVTVEDRYEMKKKVRELKGRESLRRRKDKRWSSPFLLLLLLIILVASCDTTADGKRHLNLPEGQMLANGTIAPCDGWHTDAQACGNALFNRPLLPKIQVGMTTDEVRLIMRHDAERREINGNTETWLYMSDYEAEQMTSIIFVDRKVTAMKQVPWKS